MLGLPETVAHRWVRAHPARPMLPPHAQGCRAWSHRRTAAPPPRLCGECMAVCLKGPAHMQSTPLHEVRLGDPFRQGTLEQTRSGSYPVPYFWQLLDTKFSNDESRGMKKHSAWFASTLLVSMAMTSCESRQMKDGRTAYTALQYETAVGLFEQDIAANGGSPETFGLLVDAKWIIANRLAANGKVLQAWAQLEDVEADIERIGEDSPHSKEWYHTHFAEVKAQAAATRSAIQPTPPERMQARLRQLAAIYSFCRNEPEVISALPAIRDPVYGEYVTKMTAALIAENHEQAKQVHNALIASDEALKLVVYDLFSADQKYRMEQFRTETIALKTALERVSAAQREATPEQRFSTIAKLAAAIAGVSACKSGQMALEKEWEILEALADHVSIATALALVRDANNQPDLTTFGSRGQQVIDRLIRSTRQHYLNVAKQAQTLHLDSLRYVALNQATSTDNQSVLSADDLAFCEAMDKAAPAHARWRLSVAWQDSHLFPDTLPETLPGILVSRQRLAGVVSTRLPAEAHIGVDASALIITVVEPDPAAIRRRTGRFLAGAREVPNPHFIELRRQADWLDREIQRLDIAYRIEAQRPLGQYELVNGAALGLANARNRRIGEFNQVVASMRQTSATLREPVYNAYEYEEWSQTVGYSARGMLTVTIGGKAYQEPIQVADSRSCVVIGGIHPDDADGRRDAASTLPTTAIFRAQGRQALVDALATAITKVIRTHTANSSVDEGDLATADRLIRDSWYGAGLPATLATRFIVAPTPPKSWTMLFKSDQNGIRPSVHLRPAPIDPKPLTASEAYKQSVAAITLVSTDNGFGTGFILSPEGLMMTNAHVVEGLNTVAVAGNYSDGRVFGVAGIVIAKDVTKDLALVMLQGMEAPLHTVCMREKADIDPGADVVVIGNPGVGRGVSFNNITKGIVSNPHIEIPNIVPLVLIDAAVNPGNSGGPCIDLKTGEVIGMVTYAFNRTPGYTDRIHEGQGGAVPCDILWAFLRAHVHIIPPVPPNAVPPSSP